MSTGAPASPFAAPRSATAATILSMTVPFRKGLHCRSETASEPWMPSGRKRDQKGNKTAAQCDNITGRGEPHGMEIGQVRRPARRGAGCRRRRRGAERGRQGTQEARGRHFRGRLFLVHGAPV